MVFALAGIGLSVWQFQNLRSLNGWIERVDRLVLQILTIQREVIEAQSDIRSFLTFKDHKALQSYRNFEKGSDLLFGTFYEVSAEHPKLESQIREIEGLLPDWKREASTAIEAVQSGNPIENTEAKLQINELAEVMRQKLREAIEAGTQMRADRIQERMKTIQLYTLGSIAFLVCFIGLLYLNVRLSRRWVRKLGENEYKFRTLFEQASEGIFIADSQGTFIDANAAGLKMLSFEREGIVGKSLWDFLDDEHCRRLRVHRENLLRHGSRLVTRGLWKMNHGKTIDVEVYTQILPDSRWIFFVRAEGHLESNRDAA